MGQIWLQVARGAAAEVEEPSQVALAAQRQLDMNTPRKPKPREWTVCDADTKIPRLGAIFPGFPVPSISPPGFTQCRSFKTRSTWRCSTKPCMTFASFPPITAGIHETTG